MDLSFVATAQAHTAGPPFLAFDANNINKKAFSNFTLGEWLLLIHGQAHSQKNLTKEAG